MTESTEQPKRTETLKKAYKDEAEVKKVLDEKAIDKSLLDRLPTPTGYRMLILPYAGPKKPRVVYILVNKLKKLFNSLQ